MTGPGAGGRPPFVSFYSGDGYYERSAARLRQRCRALGIPITIEALPDAGSYWRNTLLKPSFILDKLSRLRRDLIWIDVDTDLHRDHPEFQALHADMTAASHSGDLSGVKASPIGFAYTPASLAVLAAWSAACRGRLASGDEDLDHDVLKYEILPDFAGRMTLRLMGSPDRPREFTEGATLTNGLSRRGGRTVAAVLAKNRARSARFSALRLEHFGAAVDGASDGRGGSARPRPG